MDRRMIVKNCSGCGTKHAGPFGSRCKQRSMATVAGSGFDPITKPEVHGQTSKCPQLDQALHIIRKWQGPTSLVGHLYNKVILCDSFRCSIMG